MAYLTKGRSNNPYLDPTPKRKTGKTNLREQLNDACDIASEIIQTLKPIIQSNQILDKEQRENFKLAIETLKTARTLQIEDKKVNILKNSNKMGNLVDITPKLSAEEEKELQKLSASILNAKK